MRVSERIYRWMLGIYPGAFRREYGAAMAQLFRDQCREVYQAEGGWGLGKLWLRTFWDLGRSAGREHVELLKGTLSMSTKPRFGRRGIALTAFLLVCGFTLVVTWLQTPYFSSTARITVHKDAPPSPGGSESLFAGTEYDPYFLQTEFERISSKEVLYQVIADLDLQKRWTAKFHLETPLSTEETYSLLKRSLNVRSRRNTSLIEIRVFNEDRQEAAEIANKIAASYRNLRLDRLRIASLQGMDMLEKEREAQEHKVKMAQDKLLQLQKQSGITDYSLGESQGISEGIRELERQIRETESAVIQASTQRDRLHALGFSELRQVLPVVFPDTLLTELLSRVNQTETELLALQKERTAQHPDVQKVQAVLDKLNEQTGARIQGILAGLEFKTRSLEQDLKLENTRLEVQRRRQVERASTGQEYASAKRELEQHKQLLQALDLKLFQEKVDAQTAPGTPTVEVVDQAEPGLRPVRPNWPANLAVGLLLGMLASGLMILLRPSKGLVPPNHPASA